LSQPFFILDDQILGLQGHPEFTPELMSEITTDRKNLIDLHIYQAALCSLDEGFPDNRLSAQWIVNFLVS